MKGNLSQISKISNKITKIWSFKKTVGKSIFTKIVLLFFKRCLRICLFLELLLKVVIFVKNQLKSIIYENSN